MNIKKIFVSALVMFIGVTVFAGIPIYLMYGIFELLLMACIVVGFVVFVLGFVYGMSAFD